MRVIIIKDNKSIPLSLDNLVTDEISDIVFGENVREEEDAVEIETTNPIYYKEKNLASVQNNGHAIYDIVDVDTTLNYDSTTNNATNFLNSIRNGNGESIPNGSIISSLFKVTITNKREVSPLAEVFKAIVDETNPNRNINVRPSIHSSGGFYFKYLGDSNIKAYSYNEFSNILNSSSYQSSRKKESFLNNMYYDNRICWNSYSENISEYKRANTNKKSDMSNLLKYSTNLFLGSVFNNDLTTEEINLSRASILGIIDCMISMDYEKYVNVEKSNAIRRYIINNSQSILQGLNRNLKTTDLLVLSTLFEIPYHVFYL